jgi:hypothetical protein
LTAAAHAVPAFDTGAFVWVRWGNTRGVQLGQVVHGLPAIYSGEAFYRVRVFSKKHGRWNEGTTERRILRALTGAEIRKYQAVGVLPERQVDP